MLTLPAIGRETCRQAGLRRYRSQRRRWRVIESKTTPCAPGVLRIAVEEFGVKGMGPEEYLQRADEPEDGMFFTYANHLQIGFTHFDVRLVFGEVVDVEQGSVSVEQRAQVTLSWGQAKLLQHILGDVLKNHEAAQGEIKLPPGMTDLQDLTRKQKSRRP